MDNGICNSKRSIRTKIYLSAQKNNWDKAKSSEIKLDTSSQAYAKQILKPKAKKFKTLF